MKHIKRMAALCIVLCLLCGLHLTAYALEAPDPARKGSITVQMKDGGKTITGGTLTAYRVGELREDNGNYSFEKTATMADFPQSYGDIDSASLAEQVNTFVKEHKLPAYGTADNKNGNVVFTDLELGLYLIVQTTPSDGYAPLNSFLVTVPIQEDGNYVYEVNAAGKFQLAQKPGPTDPSKPPKPNLPQTGQLNWPVPVLAAMGIGLLVLGLALRLAGRKGQRNA